MKKIILLIAALSIILLSPLQKLAAQDNKPEKDRKVEVIVKQKKAADARHEAMNDSVDVYVDEQQIQDQIESQMEKLREQMENGDLKNYHFYDNDGMRSFSFDAFPNPPEPPDVPDTRFFMHYSGDAERTTWDFSKSIKDNSFSQDYSFDVEKNAKNFLMSVMGDCKAGEIKISIEAPSGKKYSDIVIDEYGNLNWRKSFNISETENQDKTGKWTFKIDSKKATGFFKISLQTY